MSLPRPCRREWPSEYRSEKSLNVMADALKFHWLPAVYFCPGGHDGDLSQLVFLFSSFIYFPSGYTFRRINANHSTAVIFPKFSFLQKFKEFDKFSLSGC